MNDFIALFNVIDPLDGIYGHLRHGAMHKFEYDRDGSFTIGQVDSLLRAYHVTAYGKAWSKTTVSFYVKRRQAEWAEHILYRAGVPLVGPPLRMSNATASQRFAGSLPPAWSNGARPTIVGFMDIIIGGMFGIGRYRVPRRQPRRDRWSWLRGRR